MAQLTNGHDVTAADWNAQDTRITTLENEVTSSPQPSKLDHGTAAITPNGSGDGTFLFAVTFTGTPTVTVTGSAGRPNTLVTLYNDASLTSTGCKVHFSDNNGNPVTTGTVTVNWIAAGT